MQFRCVTLDALLKCQTLFGEHVLEDLETVPNSLTLHLILNLLINEMPDLVNLKTLLAHLIVLVHDGISLGRRALLRLLGQCE